jgi:hypothetical protein
MVLTRRFLINAGIPSLFLASTLAFFESDATISENQKENPKNQHTLKEIAQQF